MLPQKLIITCLVVFTVFLLDRVNGKSKDGDCEVCVKFLKKFEATLTDDDRVDQEIIKWSLRKMCGKAKGKENKFCYYVGGTSDAATSILGDITKPLGFHKPVEAICKDLKKKDRQICELQYEKELDWKNINLKKMRVKELKKILSKWDENCEGCLEKSDYIKKINDVKNKHIEL